MKSSFGKWYFLCKLCGQQVSFYDRFGWNHEWDFEDWDAVNHLILSNHPIEPILEKFKDWITALGVKIDPYLEDINVDIESNIQNMDNYSLGIS